MAVQLLSFSIFLTRTQNWVNRKSFVNGEKGVLHQGTVGLTVGFDNASEHDVEGGNSRWNVTRT